MLNENIKTIRKSKGLSQEELAVRLNVVRQTVSKWEQGLSVPDADMLISISEVLDTPVSVLLGETVAEKEADELKAISEKLEVINLQLAHNKAARRKVFHWLFIALFSLTVVGFAVLFFLGSPCFRVAVCADRPVCSCRLSCRRGPDEGKKVAKQLFGAKILLRRQLLFQCLPCIKTSCCAATAFSVSQSR